jgi:hypothetical protein
MISIYVGPLCFMCSPIKIEDSGGIRVLCFLNMKMTTPSSIEMCILFCFHWIMVKSYPLNRSLRNLGSKEALILDLAKVIY